MSAVSPMDVMTVIGLDGIVRASLRNGRVSASGGNVQRHAGDGAPAAAIPNGTFLSPSPLDGQVRYFSHRRLRDYPLFVTYGVLEAEVLAAVPPPRR